MITQFIEALLLGVSMGTLTAFVAFCLEEGHIFSFWTRFIDRYLEAYPWLHKPLGGCPYCLGTWLTIGAYIIYALLFGLHFFFLFPVIGISYATALYVIRKYES
jgi:hypothetical protein